MILNSYTLTLYTIASGLCFCLSLVLLVFSQIRRGTYLIRSSSWGLVILGLGFFGAGMGPLMPFWVTVIGMNALLLSAGLMFFGGIRALVFQQSPKFDVMGGGIVALAMPFFVYWGFIDPDGMRRAMVFSVAAALINGRSAALLTRHLRKTPFNPALLLVAFTFAVLSVWMLGRGLHLLLAVPLPGDIKSTNPTTWPTVFAFNVLISIFAASLLAAEIGVQRQYQQKHDTSAEGTVQTVRDNLVLLWGIVTVVLVAILSETGIGYLVLYQREQQQLKEQNSLANQAMVEHAQQLVGQADLVLRATRDLAQKGYPAKALEEFTSSLRVEQPIFENTYLLAADGQQILPTTDRENGNNATQRDNLHFHQARSQDVLYISPISIVQTTGKPQFHISRRVNDAHGRFAGVVLVTLEPTVLTRYYGQLITGADGVAALLGDDDHRIRARLPLLDSAQLAEPLRSPLWNLHRAESGHFSATSMVDGIERQYFYRRLQGLPLVMVTGFSDADVHRNALASLKPIALGAVLAIAVVLAMAFMLAAALRRRDEQDRFLSMISHELRTPMSVIRMVSGSAAMPENTKNRVVRAVNDMSAIVDSALQADRLRHGRVRAHVSDCDLNELLQTVRQNAAEPERIQIDETTNTPVQTDPQLFKVVVGNLIDNALKYSAPHSTVHLQAVATEHQRKPGVGITVSNQAGAMGLPDARQVFRKFYRAPGARGKTGSGLGLHISDGMARLLGGHLKYSAQGNKVQFTLWMPL